MADDITRDRGGVPLAIDTVRIDTASALARGEGLIACPACDLLYVRPVLEVKEIARCKRCDHVIMTRKAETLDRALAAAVASAILLVTAAVFPFLSLERAGIGREISLFDAIGALSQDGLWALAVIAGLLVIGIPAARIGAIVYVLLPLRLDLPPLPRAGIIFRHVVRLEQWAMTEIFLIGVIVSLVKLQTLADLVIGPAFWAIAGLVVVTAYKSIALCKSTVWDLIDPARP